MTPLEMTIPKSRGMTIFKITITVIVILSSMLAVFNLFNRISIIASSIWLIFITMMIWTACKKEGGLRNFLVNRLGDVAGRQFVESVPQDMQPIEVNFGYQLFGHRFIQRTIALDKIETVEWCHGQATDMAGRDMNDWSVYLWFDHDNSAKRKKWSRKPDQDIYIVGPSRRWEDTDAFGRSFVGFLCAAGAVLVRCDKTFCFVRRKSENNTD
jgi:hypothetical protein